MNHLFSQQQDSAIKKKEVSDELASLKFEDYTKNNDDDKDALTKIVNIIAKLYPVSISSDRNKAIQIRFFKEAVSGSD